jgi:hypothetical protein
MLTRSSDGTAEHATQGNPKFCVGDRVIVVAHGSRLASTSSSSSSAAAAISLLVEEGRFSGDGETSAILIGGFGRAVSCLDKAVNAILAGSGREGLFWKKQS